MNAEITQPIAYGPRRRARSWRGLGAVVGGLCGVLLTPFLTNSYYRACHALGHGAQCGSAPTWVAGLHPLLQPFESLGLPWNVYQTFGRLFSVLVLPLLLLGYLALHRRVATRDMRLERWSFRVVLVSIGVLLIGLCGDYVVPNSPNAAVRDIGYVFEVLGILMLTVSTTVWVISFRFTSGIPRTLFWSLALCVPGTVVCSLFVKHAPEATTLYLSAVWIALGWWLWRSHEPTGEQGVEASSLTL